MMCERLLLISVVTLVFGAPASNAALLTKELAHVTFADGGSATGSLVLDTKLKPNPAIRHSHHTQQQRRVSVRIPLRYRSHRRAK
jgi:hypothetical protein